MMRTIFFLFILCTIVSCSSSRLDRKINDAEWDSLADETYLRWGNDRLKNEVKKGLVVNCYQGKANETLENYKKEFITKADTPYYWLDIGNCYFVKDDWSKAEFFYRMTLEESKTSIAKSIALNNLGLINFKYEQWEKGKDFLRQSIELAPRFKVPLYNLSQLYLQFGFFDRAIEILTSSAFKGHKDVDVYFSLANAYLFKRDLVKANEYFQLIPKDFLQREDIAATFALYLLQRGDVEGASNAMKNRERSGVAELTVISQKIEKILTARMKQE